MQKMFPFDDIVMVVCIHIKASMLVNKDFQTWHLIGGQHSHQASRSHVRKPLFTNMEFIIEFT